MVPVYNYKKFSATVSLAVLGDISKWVETLLEFIYKLYYSSYLFLKKSKKGGHVSIYFL